MRPAPTARRTAPRLEPLEPRRLFAVAGGFTESAFAAGLDRPTALAFAPDGRLFVAEQDGNLRVVKGGQLLPAPAVDLAVDDQGERGLLGIAFDPAFAQNGFVYLYHTVETPLVHNRISRFTLAGDAVQPGSEQVLIDLPNLTAATNHNGGAMHFGPDGKLYVAVGDNNDPANAQPLSTVLGKMLRTNADGTIPGDNPFVASTTGLNRAIWATGLRNPYTFAFRPSDGRMHINDVGQGSFEEINVGSAGANFGWPEIEGRRTNQTPPANYSDPLLAYGRSGPVAGSSIAGGAFYEPPAGAASTFPAALAGDYFFADWGAGFVKSIDPATAVVSDFASGLNGPVDLAVGPDGGVYAVEYFAGRVTRFAAADPAGNPTPPPATAADLSASVETEPPAAAVQGTGGRAVVRVANVGSAAARGRVTVRLLGSADAAVDDADVSLREAAKSVRLSPGRSTALRLKFVYPAAFTGAMRLVAQIVPADAVGDGNAANNAAASAGAVQVAAPFVDVGTRFRASAVTVTAGRRASVVLDLSNAGNATFVGRLSPLFVFRAADVRETVSPPPGPRLRIAPGGTRSVRFRVDVPATLAAGAYELLVIVPPPPEVVNDPDAGNNEASIPATVSAGA